MQTNSATGVAERFSDIVGDDHVVRDAETLEYLSRDLSFEPFQQAEVGVVPGSLEELAAVVEAANAAGMAVVARGGGMSYTKGYTPARAGSVIVDMRRMNRILEVNAQDGYVTVECGVTWEQLYETLREHGLRTPYYGPLSGRYATVGGALSQNSVFWGAARHGMVADSAISLTVVAAGGRVIRTGSASRPGSGPFFRNFGPDTTGLFLGDTGALAIKAHATLATLPLPQHTLHHSVSVPELATAIDCMEATGRLGIATEIYNLDPYYADSMVKAGVEVLAEHPWTVHFTVDGATQAIADAGMAKVREVADTFGTALDPVVPALFRSDPFGSVQAVLLGPEGQIWLPIHGVLPYSRAKQAAVAVKRFADEHQELLDRHGIKLSYLTVASKNVFIFEPAFYWFDELGSFRLERITPEAADEWRSISADEGARGAVLELRRELASLFDELGGVHIQLAKYYAYGTMLEPEALALVTAVKEHLDPDGLMNPGALGLA